MARLAIDNKPMSWIALLLVLALYGLMVWALTGSPVHKLGGVIYLIAIASIVVPMSAREDALAIFGVMGLSLLVILDIYKDIGVLTHY